MEKHTSDMPLVSVAMVTYNSAKYVQMAIESVLASSYTHFELIISDDCSNDDTWNIVQQFHDPRIVASRNESNMGEYPNRNKCIEQAKGKYFIFVDGDDYIYPNGLEFMTKMLNEFSECAMTIVNGAFNNVIFPCIIQPKEFYQVQYFGNGFLSSSFINTLFKTEILKANNGLPPHIRTGDDYIRLKIAATHPVLLINDGYTWWRETPGQASQKVRKNLLMSLEHYKYKIELLLDSDCPLTPSEKKTGLKIIHSAIFKTIIKAALKGKWVTSFQIAKAFHLNLFHFDLLFLKRKSIKKFKDYSSDQPYMLLIHRNPFDINNQPN